MTLPVEGCAHTRALNTLCNRIARTRRCVSSARIAAHTCKCVYVCIRTLLRRLTYTRVPRPEWTKHEHADEPRADVSRRSFCQILGYVHANTPTSVAPHLSAISPSSFLSRYPATPRPFPRSDRLKWFVFDLTTTERAWHRRRNTSLPSYPRARRRSLRSFQSRKEGR